MLDNRAAQTLQSLICGTAKSIAQVGLLHMYGLGCVKNETLAHKYLLFAGQKDNLCAMAHLSVYYIIHKLAESALSWASRVIDVVKDSPSKADVDASLERLRQPGPLHQDEEIMQRAVAIAYFVLGYLHETGKAVGCNRKLAIEYYSLADNLDADAVPFLGECMKL